MPEGDNGGKKREKRGEALRGWLSSPSKTAEITDKSEASKMKETAESEEKIRNRKNVNMYLPGSDVQEMQIRFDELNARHRRVHGRPMEKNRNYHPALIRAVLNDTSLTEELGFVDNGE